MSWEDKVFHDPDGVDVDALFEDLHSDDGRTQYEAVVGVYWLAHARPERVRPRGDELLDLVGELPEFGLGGSSTTRRWFAEGVAELLRAYPEQFVPPVMEQLDADREASREDAARVFGYAAGRASSGDCLSWLRNNHAKFAALLDDPNDVVRTSALSALVGIADEHPETVAHLVTRVATFLDQTRPDTSAIVFLTKIAADSPELVEPAVEPLVDVCERLDSDNVGTAKVTLEALIELAEEYPEKVARAERDVAELAQSDKQPVSNPATTLLTKVR